MLLKGKKGNTQGIEQTQRIEIVDFTRGLACIGMFFYHFLFDLYITGLVETSLVKNLYATIAQHMILSTFVLVSGISFMLAASPKLDKKKTLNKAVKLGMIAMLITLATYVVMPQAYVRFGVIHFFTLAMLLAMIFVKLKHWAVLLGSIIIFFGILMTRAGLYPHNWLYITGLMSERPSSIDYIPLIPWFGVFLLGMGLALKVKALSLVIKLNFLGAKPIVALGKHALAFYLIHQLVLFTLLQGIAVIIA